MAANGREDSLHVHHWHIESSRRGDGKFHGRCQACGEPGVWPGRFIAREGIPLHRLPLDLLAEERSLTSSKRTYVAQKYRRMEAST